MKVNILGCGSALPTMHHNNAAQVVEVEGRLYLIDCGEGTQVWLRRSKLSFLRISAIFISHIHGDHVFGLIGLISSFNLLDRKAPLHIYAPIELKELLFTQIRMFCRDMGYEVIFHAIDTTKKQLIFEDEKVTVQSLPLNHRLPCSGFIFSEKQKLPHINRQMVDFYKVPNYKLNAIKSGEDFITEEGEIIPSSRLTIPAEKPRSYAYCSDTRYMPDLFKNLNGVDILYHEATYANDRADSAAKYHHSTAEEAAKVAQAAGVEKLYIGHYSQRYNNETCLLEEAKRVFSETYLTKECMEITV
ncbi:MAG: ribonuclease Z [Prevotella sp.]|nr:ribonuclease Z [Prevotella sp.]